MLKNCYVFLFALVANFSVFCQNPDQIVNIPDVNFKTYLIENTEINTNGDDEIQVSEADSFTGKIGRFICSQ